MGSALLLSGLAGLGLGILSTHRAGPATDLAPRTASLADYAGPPFWLGQLILLAGAAGDVLRPQG
jgi:ABC-type dipeptide/oligopeptide/nickel transport system permease component